MSNNHNETKSERTFRAVLSAINTARMVNISRSGIYRRLAAGDFPQPIRLSPRRVGFLVEDVQRWIDERKAGRGGNG